MKRSIKVFLLACSLMILLEGCLISSLFPLWDVSTRIFEPDLVGEWYFEGDSTTNYTLEPLGDTAYYFISQYPQSLFNEDTIIVTKQIATLVKLGEFTFLDLYPWDDEEGESEIFNRFQENYLPVHTFLKIEYDHQELTVYSMDGEHLDELFEKNRIRLKHEMIGDFTLLTAKTKELQAFMRKYADDPEAFVEPSVFQKR